MTDTIRRDLLKMAGGATALASTGLASADQSTHELVINAPTNNGQGVGYAFAVSGTLRKIANPTQAPIDTSKVTKDPEDDLDGCVVHGVSAGGFDAYEYTGDIIAFDIPRRWADQCNVYIDGQQVNAKQLITAQNPHEVSCGGGGGDGGGGGSDTNGGAQETSQGDWCSLNNQIEFEETYTGDPMTFDVAVTGEIELDNGRRVERARGELDPHYQRKKELDYSGAIKNLSVEGEGNVTIRQKDDCK